jgi:hypothetical protein
MHYVDGDSCYSLPVILLNLKIFWLIFQLSIS